MQLRHRGFSIEEYDTEPIGFATFLAVVAFVIFFLFSALIYGGMQSDHNAIATARQALAGSVNSVDGSARVERIDTILSLDKNGSDIVSAASDDDLSTDKIKEMLGHSAQKNQDIALDATRRGWDIYWKVFIPGAIAVIFGVWSLFCLIWYVFESQDARHFLADVPKRSWLLMGFMALTFLPLGWLLYGYSAVCVWYFRRTNGAERPARRGRYDYYDNFLEEPMMARHKNGVVRYRFATQDIDQARRAFVTFRQEGMQKRRERMISVLRQEVQELRDKITKRGKKLEEVQREHAVKKREYDALCAQDPDVQATGESADGDFNNILALKGVTDVAMKDDALHIKVDVRVNYNDVLYDFGDWELILSNYRIDSRLLRRATLSGEPESYPDYDYGDGRFCFHSWSYSIDRCLNEDDIVGAATLAVNALHSVNRGDEYRIPRTFMKAKV